MATQREKVEARLAGNLMPDERVLHAVAAFRIGGVRSTMIGGAAGIGGLAGAAGMALVARRGRTEVLQVPIRTPGRFILALTSQRFVLFTLGGFIRPAPGKLVHSWTLDRLAWVSDPELVPGVAQALRVQVGVAGEGILGFEFPRLNVQEGRSMIERLTRELADLDERGPVDAVDGPDAVS
ncbi:hypothetical protein LN042_09165 [Kitasatospora sp. RB6PN24]|uniref:hypothetical protein n=1 Tax=Kitasatospora humi TaxID=2893891 RepID=UPI001E6222C1|nr:hypothetical protein [Kitasatospora humi]MCC9307269.1 hypothetical protein [Kitasatospora humi]